MTTSRRRSDDELNVYHGGRAAYLEILGKQLSEARGQLLTGDFGDKEMMDVLVVCERHQRQMVEQRIQILERAIKDNQP